MTVERWQTVKSVLAEALERPSDERQAFVAAACGGDANLQREVESLLMGVPDGFLQDPLVDLTPLAPLGTEDWIDPGSGSAAVAHEELPAGTRLGTYEIERALGRGGMGTVYLAARGDGEFRQRVAIKIIQPGLATSDVLRRFRAERQILATLNHPNIARLIDGGTAPDGRPYLVMEYIDGVPIDRYCDARRLSVTERLSLFRKVCDAVQFAHSHLVVHRDLKPTNLLVTTDGVPKLLDFGIAKLLGAEFTGVTLLETSADVRAMTPEYAAPEQVMGEPVSTVTDVYALGLLLYELLTGTRACALTGRTPPEVWRIVCETEPKRPSAVVATTRFPLAAASQAPRDIAAARSTTPDRLARTLTGDLDNIVLMALRKEPHRRYGSVEQLSDDLRRYDERMPVIAHKDTFAYRGTKFLRRHAAGVAAGTLVMAMLVAGIVFMTEERNRAEEQRARAEAGEHRNRQLLYAAQMSLAYQAWETGNAGRAIELLEAQRPAGAGADPRGFEWHLLWRLAHERARVLRGPDHQVSDIAFLPDNRLLAATGRGGTQLWDVTSGLATAFRESADAVWSMALSPDGATFAEGQLEGQVRLRDVGTGQTRKAFRAHTDMVTWVGFSPDGKTLATTSIDGTARLWSRDGAPGPTLRGHTQGVWTAAFAPDGRQLATASRDSTIMLWDPETGQRIRTLRGHSWWVLAVAFAPDGQSVASSGSDGHVKIWDASTGTPLRMIAGDGRTVDALRYSPDGTTLAIGAQADVLLYDTKSLRQTEVLRGHTDVVRSIAFAADGRTLASGSLDRTVRLWDLSQQPGSVTIDGHRDWPWHLAFSPDGRRLATAGKDAVVKLWSVDATRELLTLRHPVWVNAVAFSPDGRSVITGSDDQIVRVWDARTGEQRLTLAGQSAFYTVAVSWDGRLVAAGTKSGEVWLWNAQTGQRLATFRRPGRHLVWSVAFSPDDKYVASAEAGADERASPQDDAVVLWDVASGQAAATLQGHTDDVRSVSFSPDGSFLASGSYDGTIRFWEIATRRQVGAMRGHKVVALTFSQDGKRLLTGGLDKTVKLWDVATRQELCTLTLPSEITSVGFSPDNSAIAVAAKDNKVRLWFGHLTRD